MRVRRRPWPRHRGGITRDNVGPEQDVDDTPRGPERRLGVRFGFDHAVIFVSDLRRASDDFTALGFQVVSGGVHAGGLTHKDIDLAKAMNAIAQQLGVG